jgi:hypothetical protein
MPFEIGAIHPYPGGFEAAVMSFAIDQVAPWFPEDVTSIMELFAAMIAQIVPVFSSSTVPVWTWEKQVLSARGFKRIGRHSEHAI